MASGARSAKWIRSEEVFLRDRHDFNLALLQPEARADVSRRPPGFRLVTEELMPNPLLGLPRNMRCPCGSGGKFKNCCLPLTKRFIAKETLVETRLVMAEALEGRRAW